MMCITVSNDDWGMYDVLYVHKNVQGTQLSRKSCYIVMSGLLETTTMDSCALSPLCRSRGARIQDMGDCESQVEGREGQDKAKGMDA